MIKMCRYSRKLIPERFGLRLELKKNLPKQDILESFPTISKKSPKYADYPPLLDTDLQPYAPGGTFRGAALFGGRQN